MRLVATRGTASLIVLGLACVVACAAPPSRDAVHRPHPELEVNLELESEVPADPGPAPGKPKPMEEAESDGASNDAPGDVPEQGTVLRESIEERVARLLVSLGETVDRHKLYYDEDVRVAIGQMRSREIEELIDLNGYIDRDVNRSGPIHCTREEIREKVDICAREFVRFIQRYKRFRDNKRFPPKWSTQGDFVVLSFDFGDYELIFSREPFALEEVQYHNVESGH